MSVRPAIIDVAIAAVTLGASIALLFHGVPAGRSASGLDVLSATLAAGATVPLVAWRRAPRAVFVVTASASAIVAAAGYSPGAPLGPTAALYLLAASRDDARPWTRRTTAVTLALFAAFVATTTTGERSFQGGLVLHIALAWVAGWFAGERTRLRREHVADLEARALRTEHDSERERQLAVAEERARIARDLHDSAGHAISLIVVRAGAARLRHDEDPERSRHALQAIEQVARHTAAEIDEIVGTLRDEDANRGVAEAPPGLASLGTLLDRHASAGLDVTIDTVGVARPLEGPLDVAAYRILQEALTNAARHGNGSAQVELSFGDGGLELMIVNPVPFAAAPGSPGGGHGLIGMNERATLMDGSFAAERVNGSFRVCAQLPYAGRRA